MYKKGASRMNGTAKIEYISPDFTEARISGRIGGRVERFWRRHDSGPKVIFDVGDDEFGVGTVEVARMGDPEKELRRAIDKYLEPLKPSPQLKKSEESVFKFEIHCPKCLDMFKSRREWRPPFVYNCPCGYKLEAKDD